VLFNEQAAEGIAQHAVDCVGALLPARLLFCGAGEDGGAESEALIAEGLGEEGRR
jgi:hypothetical protein